MVLKTRVLQTSPLPEGLSGLELQDLLAFNNQVAKLALAGVPIRFAGAPHSISEWLQGISNRAAVNVGLGQTAFGALSSEPSINAQYVAALAAWLGSKTSGGGPDFEGDGSQGSLKVLEPWVQKGLQGNRQVDKSAIYAFWLWIVAMLASVVLIHTVWLLFPKLAKFYDNSGYEIGIGYRWLEWIHDRLAWVACSLAGILIAAPLLWRAWFSSIAQHWSLPKYFSQGFFLAYLLLGGIITAVLGWTVFWPVIEMLVCVGEPQP